MEEKERIIKGIWIPIEIWKDKNLQWNEKLLLLEIDSYTSKDKDCYISDEYISEFLGINKTNANKTLSSLIKKGYVIKTRFDGRRRYVKAALSTATTLTCQKQQTSHARSNHNPIQDNSNNTTYNNLPNKEEDTNVSPKKEEVKYQEVIDCWNKSVGKKWGCVTRITDRRKESIKRVLKTQDISQETLKRFFKTLPYADSWLSNPNTAHATWKPDFDWWMKNTNNWLTKGLEGGVHRENPVTFRTIMNGASEDAYLPKGKRIWFNPDTQSYWSDELYIEHLYDGYSDEDRPDKATLTLHNGRGNISWNKEIRRWMKQ